jgi:hypothetical protein
MRPKMADRGQWIKAAHFIVLGKQREGGGRGQGPNVPFKSRISVTHFLPLGLNSTSWGPNLQHVPSENNSKSSVEQCPSVTLPPPLDSSPLCFLGTCDYISILGSFAITHYTPIKALLLLRSRVYKNLGKDVGAFGTIAHLP